MAKKTKPRKTLRIAAWLGLLRAFTWVYKPVDWINVYILDKLLDAIDTRDSK
jgi:hypothetical protein